MQNRPTLSSGYTDTKSHYVVLDGLRGVAALVVVWFHIFEAFATSHLDQNLNHGYLAVDFFFILSGFVVGYAYDDRWNTMTPMEFIKRRLIRLHPMVVMGALIGGALFYFQGCTVFDVTQVSVFALLFATLLNMFLLPATVGSEIRGFGEMFPLNGPTWSLFFEYIGSVMYMLFIRKLSTKVLSVFVFVAACALSAFAIWGPYGDLCAGYSLRGIDITGGLFRFIFSFSAGLLMFRLFKPIHLKGGFWICSLLLVVLLVFPRIGGAEYMWLNGIYDTVCVLLCFPLFVYLGASTRVTSKFTTSLCTFLGNLSYPLYMVHYPFFFVYYAWVKNEQLTFEQSLFGAIALFVGSILVAYLCLKFYDTPVRSYLSKRFLKSKQQ